MKQRDQKTDYWGLASGMSTTAIATDVHASWFNTLQDPYPLRIWGRGKASSPGEYGVRVS